MRMHIYRFDKTDVEMELIDDIADSFNRAQRKLLFMGNIPAQDYPSYRYVFDRLKDRDVPMHHIQNRRMRLTRIVNK